MPRNLYDKGTVRAALRNVHGDIIRGRVRFTFVNQRVHSFNRQAHVVFQGRARRIGGIPAGPVGLYQVFINPEKYREKTIFLMVSTDKPAVIDEVFFVEPGKAKPKFPTYAALKQQKPWAKLIRIFAGSGITARKYDALPDLPKAGIFNLFAKMESTGLPGGTTVFDHVKNIRGPKPARFYANVDSELLQLVREDRVGFHGVPGTLHHFPQGWRRIDEFGSVKTLDRAGNLQLTFATNRKGQFLVDSDIDDHRGIQHAFDVIKHKVTGKDTHPYDIHQILVFFQGIDPGYQLA